MTRALQVLARLEEFLLASVMIAMVVLFSGAVLVRELSIELARQIEWIDEATRYLMVWMVFLGLGLALGGAAGNLIDMLRLRYVVDFIGVRWCGVFNLADVAIVAGLAMALWPHP